MLATEIGDGWWRTADVMAEVDWKQVAVFWSVLFGAMLGLLGWILRTGGVPTRAWSVAFAALCFVGALAVPPGGFWIGLVLGVWLAARAPR